MFQRCNKIDFEEQNTYSKTDGMQGGMLALDHNKLYSRAVCGGRESTKDTNLNTS